MTPPGTEGTRLGKNYSYESGDLVVVGPASFYGTYNAIGIKTSSFATFEVTKVTDTGTPSTSVVIPNDNGGPVTIVLESSVDLVTWTAANPGSYGTTTEKRFFRVWAIR